MQQLVAQIPWGHNVRLLELVKEPKERGQRGFSLDFDGLNAVVRGTGCPPAEVLVVMPVRELLPKRI